MGAAAEEQHTVPTGKREGLRPFQAAAPPVNDAKSTLDVGNVMSKVGLKEKEPKEWNSKNLPSRVGVDALCAFTAGGMVAPLITVIDRAIIENASGKRPMMESFKAEMGKLLLRPHHFLVSRPFRLILMLYGGTYAAANGLDTFSSTVKGRPATSTTSGLSKFATTSTANLSLCLYKDSQFTKMFGTVAARPIPPVSYALFMARDSLTIFASFNLPPLLAPALPLSEAAERYISRASTAQFIAPAAIQLISTPLHLLGLDLYNREKASTMDRLRKVRIDWLKSSIARMCRIVPAFGFGGVVNNGMRKNLMQGLE